jgi:hypothetical protein
MKARRTLTLSQIPSSDSKPDGLGQPVPSLLDGIFSLTTGAKAALEVLRAVTVRHAMFYSVFSKIAHQAQFAPPGHIVFVIGPTGAGKTTLANALQSQLADHFRALGTRSGSTPFFYMNLKLENSKEFVWKRFYLGALRELNEPLLDKKVNLKEELARLRQNGVPAGPAPIADQDIGVLRDLLEHQLKARDVRFALIDEGNLLAMIKGTGDDLKAQMEVLKSLAGSVPTCRLIFFATSDALPLLHLSPQLSRRIIVIRFNPYGSEKESLTQLGSGLLPYLAALPCGYSFELKKQIRAIQATASGLFGASAEWIQRAAAPALMAGRPMTWEDMEEAKPDQLTIDALRRDVEHFKRYFSEGSPNKPPEGDKAPREPTSSRRPGRRTPKRDRQSFAA